MPTRLFPQERQQRILAFLQERGRVSVSELSQAFNISPVTIRADLEQLSEQGLLTRTHGGAIATRDSSGKDLELSFDIRRRMQVTEKERIGAAAAALVNDGEAILLDASTTSLAVARQLKSRRDLTIITNSIAVANELMDADSLSVLIPGGFLRRDTASLVGMERLEFLSDYNIQKGFFGAKGLALEKGLTDVNQLEVEAKREFIRLTHQVIAVVDGSKWGQVSFVSFAALDQLHTVISDPSAPPEMVAALRDRGIQVIIV